MIRLVVFVPCERLIIGQDNLSSLINVLEHVQVPVDNRDIPENAGVPFNWTVLALWHREIEMDEPVLYDVKFELVSPNGKAAISGNVNFVVSNEHLNFRNTFIFPVFPLTEPGIHKALLSYKRSDEEVWEQVGEYPIQLIHNLIKTDENENKVENEQPIKSV